MAMIRWDEAKRRSNLEKHSVDFAAAIEFDWETAIVFEDTRFDYGEVRFIAIGRIAAKVYTMVFTEILDGLRIISLRPAHRKERMRYEESNR
jgi:uncharacterized protein